METDTATTAKNPYNEPEPPGKPEIKDWGKAFAELKWAPPRSDGGAPITSYIIEKKDQYSSKWQKGIEIIGNKTTAKIPDLVEGMKYQFRVKAVNDGGVSKPSPPSDTITAKDRFCESPFEALRADPTNEHRLFCFLRLFPAPPAYRSIDAEERQDQGRTTNPIRRESHRRAAPDKNLVP